MDFREEQEMDVAYKILQENNASIYWRELIEEVIRRKKKSVQSLSTAISEIYTMLNMDSRFYHEGNGKWGLYEWKPPETKRTRLSAAAKNAAADRKGNESKLESIQE